MIIYKYPLTLGMNTIKTHKNCKPLTAQIQGDANDLVLWVQLDKDEIKENIDILVAMTGEQINISDDRLRYISTVQLGYLVFHIYEVYEAAD